MRDSYNIDTARPELPPLAVPIAEAAELVRLSERRLRALVDSGSIPAHVLPGVGQRRHIRIRVTDLDAWLERLPLAAPTPAPCIYQPERRAAPCHANAS